MIAPLLTFALQAATYQVGMPTHNYNNKNKQDLKQMLNTTYQQEGHSSLVAH